MDKENQYFLVTSLRSALEILTLIQDDIEKEQPVCDDIGAALNLPIWSISECIKLLEE